MADKKEIKKIGVLSLAKIYAVITAIFGLIIGIIYAVVGTAASVSGEAGVLAALGIGSIIVMPIVYGIIGFISGAIGAWLYNLVANWIGGIELDLK